MIPPVEERKDLSCIGCFAEQLPLNRSYLESCRPTGDQNMANYAWCKVYDQPLEVCRKHNPKCIYRFTPEQHREILDRHNQQVEGE